MLKRLVLAVAAAALAASPALAQELSGTLKKIKDSGTIVIGHREASVPFSYLDQNQKPTGYSLDLCAKIIEGVKKELKLDKLEVKYIPVNPQTRIPLVANNTVDLECGSTTYNLTRSKQVDYSHITYITGTKLLVKKKSAIREVEDLNGKAIALAQGTTNERAVKAAIEEKKLNVKVLNVKDHNEGFLALETDRVDAYSTDDILLYGLISKAKTPGDYIVTGRFLSYDPYGFMMRRDDSAFRLVVNTVLSDVFRSGEIAKIYDKWFVPMNVPMSETLATAFQVQALPY
ncbi:MAG: amino acid ABC transporter substrate-binding protein [Proteobacteria bacterium]|nr:amino acid ABC transporter substrate-binding protein [Pseudomonadota bacterium]